MLYMLCRNDGNTGIVYRDNKSLHFVRDYIISFVNSS